MIAIAGANGACGKTTTALGLAEGFARTGTPAVAIDADRQLPNAHAVGGVERTPTLGALTADADVRSIAQESPRTSRAGIVPAPKPSERLDVDDALDRIDADSVLPIVDCPSGAGPDAVEPLAATDGVVVVTTPDECSLEAARTTVEMARRLGVPVLGAVVNRADEVPTAVDSWVDVPVLGVVPEASSPLTDDGTTAVYEGIAERLRARNATARPPSDDELLPTGIDALDRRLGGGLAPGSVAALTAEPASQSEQLLYEATTPRDAVYLSTERSAANVRRAIEAASVETGTPTIRCARGADGLEAATEIIGTLPEDTTLVVDPADALERCDRSAYVDFLNELKERTVETAGMALLHCLDGADRPAARTATVHAVDAVFDLQTTEPAPGAEVERYLSVPKFRPERTGTGPIELAFDGSGPSSTEPDGGSDDE